jgi:hypothetical protein
MPKYLALFSYSGDAMAAKIESPAEREPAARTVLESVGGRRSALLVVRRRVTTPERAIWVQRVRSICYEGTSLTLRIIVSLISSNSGSSCIAGRPPNPTATTRPDRA